MRRDWSHAEAKRIQGCRLGPHGCQGPIELAHVIGRKNDPVSDRAGYDKFVRPDSIIPLCAGHHQAYDAHRIEVLPVLTVREQAQAVEDAGGIEAARRRTAPLAYRVAV